MAGSYQFFHENTYARVRGQSPPRRKAATATASLSAKTPNDDVKRSAREVVHEAIRAEHAAPHVEAPSPPRVLYGIQPGQTHAFLDRLEAQADQVQLPNGRGGMRRQRADTPILIGAVCSYPGPADDSDPLYVRWRDQTVAWLRDTYGDDQVMTILEHADEDYGHIHALVHNHGASVKPLHAGHAAAGEHPRGKAAGDAYKAGERARQDDYQAKVGAQCGLARIGPRRRRLTRAQWQATKQAGHAEALAAEQAAQRAAQARQQATEAAARAAQQAAQVEALAAQRSADLARVNDRVQAAARVANQRLQAAEAAQQALAKDKAAVARDRAAARAAIELVQASPEFELYRSAMAERQRAEAALAEAEAAKTAVTEMSAALERERAISAALQAQLRAAQGGPDAPRPAGR